jgi:hypothetical protein
MERESLDYKIVMDDGPDTEVLGRLAEAGAAEGSQPEEVVCAPDRRQEDAAAWFCRGGE